MLWPTSTIWSSAGAAVPEEVTGLRARAMAHLARLTPNSREALLLQRNEKLEWARPLILELARQ